jgi:hypothetical protein
MTYAVQKLLYDTIQTLYDRLAVKSPNGLKGPHSDPVWRAEDNEALIKAEKVLYATDEDAAEVFGHEDACSTSAPPVFPVDEDEDFEPTGIFEKLDLLHADILELLSYSAGEVPAEDILQCFDALKAEILEDQKRLQEQITKSFDEFNASWEKRNRENVDPPSEYIYLDSHCYKLCLDGPPLPLNSVVEQTEIKK